MGHFFRLTAAAGALSALLLLACDFSPTAPFSGFDGKGSRLSGIFDSGGTSAAGLTALAQSEYEGITVFVREDPNISATVKSNGTFVLVGIPQGTVTIVFQRDGRTIGRLTFRDVLPNQEIRIVVRMSDGGQVTLVEEDRDQTEDECARGAGFWCQNQGGKNPNLTAEDFQKFAADAAAMFAGKLDALNTPEAIAQAVCNTGNQLLRQLATLALNLASDRLEEGTRLVDEPYATVREAFDAAVAVATGGGDRNRIKDVLERINENRNTDTECSRDDDDGDDDDGDDDDDPPPGSGCSNLDIPKGQLPPPGECKIWDPRLPAGQQGPPGNCDQLCRTKPSGTCVIDHNGNVVC